MENYLIADSVSLERAQEVSRMLSFPLYPSEEEPFLKNLKSRAKRPEHLTLLADNFEDERLKYLFSQRAERLIDAQATDESIRDFIETTAKEELPNSLSFLLTCPVMYNCDVSRIFVDALNQKLNFTTDRFAGIHLALHEAIVNGLIHGNLDIGSEYRQSARSFVEYGKILSERLNDPAYAQKSLSISAAWDSTKLRIKIRDEGAGYVIRDNFSSRSMASAKNKTGRGLLFIAGIADSCTIDDFGREINLSFGLKDDYTQSESVYIEDKNEEEDNELQKASLYVRPSVAGCRVLIIEDNLSNQTMLYRLLNVIGITMIECATDGVEGLKRVLSFKPDLIILDITMPRMNGYEVLHSLKSSPATQDIPVLIETASDTREARDKTFRTGATDFITKPINPLEFFSRIKVHLENRMLIKHLEKQLNQLNDELNSAQRMQRTLLPTETMLKNIGDKYGIHFAHHFEPSSHLGGDFWEVIPLSDTKLAVYICDFSGHGVSAALNTFRLHALITQMDNINIEIPASAMTIMNTQLLTLLPRGQFATFFLAVIDLAKDKMVYSAAGVPKPFLICDNKIQLVNADGMPLGISKQAQYHNYQLDFPKGSKFMLYSDALTESPSDDGERLGEEGFSKLAEKIVLQSNKSPQDVVSAVIKDFFKFAPPPPPDDITIVYLERKDDQ
ncbi:MAG: SpoIIE family protein phosphatase [Alphaproteobacteria bacterium]|nr:SpoIIE family protein phosphatase [Alphaproteobacteria bacterium]